MEEFSLHVGSKVLYLRLLGLYIGMVQDFLHPQWGLGLRVQAVGVRTG